MAKYFYKRATDGLFNIDGNIVPAGNYNLLFYDSDTKVELKDSVGNNTILGPILITELLKANDTAYTNKEDLLTGVSDFFFKIDSEINNKTVIQIPQIQPVINTGSMNLDCSSHWQAMFEGRTSIETLVITDNFTITLSNAADTKLISLILTLTGTNQITFPNTVMCSNPSSKGSWSTNVLTLASGTGVIVEFQLIRYTTSSKWLLKVSEEAVV